MQSDASVSSDGLGRETAPGLEQQVIAGKYQLQRLLGQGGMGAVYEARNLSTFKRCAVKLLLSPELGHNREIVQRFFREAQACSIIESDYIVQIFDSGADPQTGFPYMVMELLQGEDLEHSLKRLGPLPPLVASKIMLQATMGLAKAHEAGIVHRDIKPANLFLTMRENGERAVKILDFGIAKVKMDNFHQTSNHGLTRTGSMLGTPLYMSPEQARGAVTKMDARSDVWSLGVVLYELLTGDLPYEDATSLGDLLVAVITQDIPLLQSRAPWVPPELAEIVHRAMSRDLDKRYANAGELRDALAALVPDGPQLHGSMLTALPAEQRAVVAPRLVLTDDGMLRAMARTGLSLSQTTSPARKKSTATVAGFAVATVLLVTGLAAGIAWRMSNNAQPMAVAESAVAVVPAVEPEPQRPAAPAEKTFQLRIAPDDAEVLIDEQRAELKNGTVEFSGQPGTTRKVKLTHHGRHTEAVVALTQDGLVPDRVELEAAPPVSPPAATPRKGGPARPASPTAPPAKAPPPPKTPKISTDTSEFG